MIAMSRVEDDQYIIRCCLSGNRIQGSNEVRCRRIPIQQEDDIIGFPDIDGIFTGEVLFLSGGDSDYVQADHQARILTLFPSATFERIEGAGHWLHAQKPREFEAAVSGFLGIEN